MRREVEPYLLEADKTVLKVLYTDIDQHGNQRDQQTDLSTPVSPDHDQVAIAKLKNANDPSSSSFEPTVFVSWDDKDLPEWVKAYIVRPYSRVAQSVVRHKTDVVFLTQLLLHFGISLPSAILLYLHFRYVHAIAHVAWILWNIGTFNLMMHNVIHNAGILSRQWSWLDKTFPIVLEPLFGHTWDSYYWHHKMHHNEGNGPGDLSSTLRYQRDDIWHFLHYVGRFLLLIWLELPLYYIRKGQMQFAIRAGGSELASYAFMTFMTLHVNTKASIFVLIIPFVTLRIGLMIGNFGQHALIDELEPDSDFRSSITLIDVASNRFCFNDGYHTSHHLNPKRHWRAHPAHFVQSKEAYKSGKALTFKDIDYLMVTFTVLRKNYDHLADCLVPMGDQIDMSKDQIVEMLKRKTRQFTEADIDRKFRRTEKTRIARPRSWVWSNLHATIRSASTSFRRRSLSIQAISTHQKAM